MSHTDGFYQPEHVVDDGSLDLVPLTEDPTNEEVASWLDFIRGQRGDASESPVGDEDGEDESTMTGTLILMTDLSLGRAINDTQLIDSLGHRFTIAAGNNFTVKVNGAEVTNENMLPEFDFSHSGPRIHNGEG